MTDKPTQITPEAEQEAQDAEQLLVVARDYKITDQESFNAAGEALKEIKRVATSLDTRRRDMTRPLDQAKQSIMDFFRKPLTALQDAERYYKRHRVQWQQEQERRRREAEAAAREKARKEEEKLRKRAEAAEKKGQTEKAETLREQADTTLVPIVPSSIQRTERISTREVWSCRVVDKMELVKAVAAGTAPDFLVVVDMKIANAQAKALKEKMNYPGLEAVKKLTEAVRS